ncbi:hypothetical protein I302_100103 [Kwoniella bestiolae CBS 10118]|uniref:Uncharacterized protein n=1 Tax=Kwoniella bestiolae CBS 10118 TaxID=1296100 RepID=A0A1B9G448_9TREE|nr:hypothetical protein I302_03477 [Kwoniella bestiolae CBS 10118]OCF25804.1 hypothetical protein I302_03477 [Kwoniella bestiolae CBS 10118]
MSSTDSCLSDYSSEGYITSSRSISKNSNHFHAPHSPSIDKPQYRHILEAPKADWTRMHNGMMKDLAISKSNAQAIFGSLSNSIVIDLLNGSDDSASFKNLRTLSLGRALTETVLEDDQGGSDDSTVKKVINILGLILKPTHICVSQPGGTQDPKEDFWQIELLEGIKPILFSGKVKSWTSHGFCFYDPFFVPPSVENINMIFPPCSLFNGTCTCLTYFEAVAFALTDPQRTQISPQLLGGDIRVNLINLPHLSRYVDPNDPDELANAVIMHDNGFPAEGGCSEITVHDLHRAFRRDVTWIKKNIKVIKKGGAGVCVCCGKD